MSPGYLPKISFFCIYIYVYLSNLDPNVWTTEHVQQWIDWAVKEYKLRDVDGSRFSTLTGVELCSMTLEDFKQVCGPFGAECLLGHLNFLRRSEWILFSFVLMIKSVDIKKKTLAQFLAILFHY